MKKKMILVPLTLCCSMLATFSCSSGKQYTVTWDLNDGQTKIQQKYHVGAKPTYPYDDPYYETDIDSDNLTQYGYFFSEWKTSSGEGIKPVKGDVTYIAQYTKKSVVTRLFFLSEDIKSDTISDKNVRISFDGNCTKVNWGLDKDLEDPTAPGLLEKDYGSSFSNESLYTEISIFGDVSGIRLTKEGAQYPLTELNGYARCIILSPKIEHIDRNAFSHVKSLSTVYIPASVKNIGYKIASFANLQCAFYCECDENSKPEGWIDGWNDDGYREPLTSIFSTYDVGVTDDGLTHMTVSYNGALETAITGYYGDNTTVNIPDSIEIDGQDKPVTAMIYSLFRNKMDVTEVDLSENLKYIGENVFQGCTSLTTVLKEDIPSNLTIIGEGAFDHCSNLGKIGGMQAPLDFSKSNKLTTIGEKAFAYTNFKEVTFPSSLTTLGAYAFVNSGLSKIDLSKATNLKSIEKHTFAGIKLGGEQASFLLPNPCNIETIGDYAFADSLGSYQGKVLLPSSLKSIGQLAFKGFPNFSDTGAAIDATAFTKKTSIPKAIVNMLDTQGGSGKKIYINRNLKGEDFIKKGWPDKATYEAID